MPVFYGFVDLSKNELRNAVVQNLGSAPATPSKGQIYMDSGTNNLYFYDGTAWVSTRSAGALTPASSVTTSSPGDGSTVGVSTNYARQDHVHGRMDMYAGTVTAATTFGLASSAGVGNNLSRYDHTHGTPTHDATAHSAIPLNSLAAANAAINAGNQLIQNVQTPASGTDGANKNYVDNAIAGLSWKESCRVATTANVTQSATQTIDGVALVVGDRVLCKNQTSAPTNGIYIVQASTWTRALDADVATEMNGMATYIEEGTTLAGTAWVLTTDPPITMGTTNLAYAQFGGGAAYIGGAGLTLTGNTFDVVAADTSITVNADSIQVNQAALVTAGFIKKYAGALTGTASPETVTHNLNTRDIQLMVMNGATPYTAVEVDWDAATVNTATVRYNPNLGAGYRVVVMG